MQDTSYGSVALIGLGASTEAAGLYLCSNPGIATSVELYAGACDNKNKARAQKLEEAGVKVIWDEQRLDKPYDLGIVSPGLPAVSDFFASAQAACTELISEPELAWRESPQDWVAITGTNGKTTTTTLTCELLRASGIEARTVGNIGLPPIACVQERKPHEVFVAELSSFQLHSVSRFVPKAAVLLNITPDHIAWHGSLEAYAQDKAQVFARMSSSDICIVGDDAPSQAIASEARSRGLRVIDLGRVPSPRELDAAWVNDQKILTVRLHSQETPLCAVDEMVLRGPHNMLNALASAACALHMGAEPQKVAAELAAFAPLEHRIELCAQKDGLKFYDDSKATNVDAVLKALDAFEPGSIVLLLGGHDKGTDLSELVCAAQKKCQSVITFGEASRRFTEALEREWSLHSENPLLLQAPHMREACELAVAHAKSPAAILLSPACSSFDEFSGYEERGDTFKAWAREYAQGVE
ncbi:MAG: UDP-N-acetylmuramoyl-L-alanine--D-glutamate ligase [Coriobacteriales bacterium]|nr:UDP-N-acetylmuramoyl-L-alanine--D-glutamate ligase [Coriobacteriales bacterium]